MVDGEDCLALSDNATNPECTIVKQKEPEGKKGGSCPLVRYHFQRNILLLFLFFVELLPLLTSQLSIKVL